MCQCPEICVRSKLMTEGSHGFFWSQRLWMQLFIVILKKKKNKKKKMKRFFRLPTL